MAKRILRDRSEIKPDALGHPSSEQVLRRPLHLSTLVLLTIGMFDLVTTLVWLSMGFQEGNRLFAWLASMGTVPFVIGKLVFLIGPVMILEYARKTHPKSAEQGTWVAPGFYALFYVSHLVQMAR